MHSIKHLSSDLAPGDSESRSFDWTRYEVKKVMSTQDPLFEVVYGKFREEFEPKGEIEEKSVLSQRLTWDPSQFKSEYSLKYEIIVVTQNGKFAAARDHSVIIRRGPHARAVIHLSHALIDPAHRGTGMAGWLRAWPIQTAQACLLASGTPPNTPITLMAEMEPYFPPGSPGNSAENNLDTGARFKSYRRAGYRMIDPMSVNYHQPDFRNPTLIDTQGGPHPLPLRLVIRRMGKESETHLPGSEVRESVSALYHMFGSSFRPKDMVPLWEEVRNLYPPDQAQVKLIEPGMDPGRERLT